MHKLKADCLLNAKCLLLAFILVSAWPGAGAAAEGADDGPTRRQENVSLFNGRDLTGWTPVGKGAAADWGVEDGSIVCRGKGHNWLRSRQEFGDFRLELEYQVTAGANSGVYVRVGANGNHHRDSLKMPPAGFEIQILDDRAPRYSQLKDYQYSASVYDIAGAVPRVSRPAGEWNTLVINCKGAHVTIVHNAVRVVDAEPGRYPLLKLRNRRGYLGLQSHNGVVRFRNFRLGPPG